MKKIIILFFITFPVYASSIPVTIEETNQQTIDRINFRLTVTTLLAQIKMQLIAIRCQGEDSEFCDKIEQTENEK